MVVFFKKLFKSFFKLFSVIKSRAEKLSSKIKISGFFRRVLAIEILCFCPPERLDPDFSTKVSYESGKFLIKSSA